MDRCLFYNSRSITSIHFDKDAVLYECLSCNKRFHQHGIAIDSLELTSTTDKLDMPTVL